MPDIDLTQIMPVTDVTVAQLASPAAYDELATHIMATPVPAVPATDPAAPPLHQPARRRPRRLLAAPLTGPAPRIRLRAVLLAAASAVVVIAVTLTLTLAQAPSALAQLTSAISRTAAQNYHFSATTTQVLRNGQGKPLATRTAFSGAFDPARATGEETFSTGAQIRFTGGYVYLNPGRVPAGQPRLPDGKTWLGAPSSAFGLPASASPQLKLFAGMTGAAGTSPQSLFTLLKSVSKVTSQGSVSGNGWTGTRYAFSDTFALGPAGRGLPTANATGTVDVDQQGRIRHLDATYTLRATPSAQPEQVTIEITFSDFDAAVSVSAPPAADVFMP